MEIPLPQRLAFILPRYGASIGGGAETLCRDLALAIKAQQPAVDIEVWTTCAMDHRTWANVHEEGVLEDGGIVLRRFAVDERDLEIFINSEHCIQRGDPFTVDQQLAWMASSVNSRGLYQHIAAHGKQFDVLLFAPYLFATTFWGSLIYPERSVIIPCLHDEPYAYLDIFRFQLSAVRGLICNAKPEQDLLQVVCGDALGAKQTAVVGMGFEPLKAQVSSIQSSIECKGQRIEKPFLLYSGRKEVGKNVDVLLNCFEQSQLEGCALLLIGAGEIDFREALPASVYDLGFVTEEEKQLLMRECLALVQPSLNESFSIVMMEAWQAETPCLVHGASAVTRHHVSTANGGLYFENGAEFEATVRWLMNNPDERRQLGLNGAAYVAGVYNWQAVVERFSDALQKFGLLTPAVTERAVQPGNEQKSNEQSAADGRSA